MGARWLVILAFGLGACTADRAEGQGRAALDAHQLAQAEDRFRVALQRDPEHIGALGGLGWTYILAGERAAGRAAFTRCVELGDHVECVRGLASLAVAEGRVSQARAMLDDAAKRHPDDSGVRASQALLALATDDLTGAEVIFDQLSARHPDVAEYQLGLAEVRLRLGDPAGCLRVVEHALTLDGTPLRFEAMLLQLQARALVASTAGRLDTDDCATTSAPVLAWLDAADESLDRAEGLAVGQPELPAARRLVSRRRAVVADQCPR